MCASPDIASELRSAVDCYQRAGLCALPALRGAKRPAVQWAEYRAGAAVDSTVWTTPHDALCLLCGPASGGLEVLDFDGGGLLYEAWTEHVLDADPDALRDLVVVRTPSGGYHVMYRCERPGGNTRLACAPDGTVYIETRGDGGLVLTAPTPGYTVVAGSIDAVPMIDDGRRNLLLNVAAGLDERRICVTEPVRGPQSTGRPGDDYSKRGDVRAVLAKHGWTLVRAGENEYWRRPGKTAGWSATLRDRVFYVFSANAAPLEPNKAYSPFAVYTLLEHAGNFQAAAAALRAEGYGSDAVGAPTDADSPATNYPITLRELLARCPEMRAPVVYGLLRQGETMNIIAPPKTGKSWLVLDLALAIACGRDWLGCACEQGPVLVIDNELHGETLASRAPKVAAARGIDIHAVDELVHVMTLRGRLVDLYGLGEYLLKHQMPEYRVIVLDAFYRFYPAKTDENDNGTMAALYNRIDAFAEQLHTSFVVVHHTSKGTQADKSVTDVGAGAGAQARATDTHLILRRHATPDAVVMEASARSWPPLQPRCLRWAWPVWVPADDLDPAMLRREGSKHGAKSIESEDPPSYDVVSFVERFMGDEPKSQSRILEEAEAEGVSSRRAKRLLSLAEEEGHVYRWSIGPRRTPAYATVEQPQDEPRDDSKRAAVEAILASEPGLSTTDVAKRCGVSWQYANRIRREST